MSEETKILSPKLMIQFGEHTYYCPGCGEPHGLGVDQPLSRTGARWAWDGNAEAPTFAPSVHIVGYCHHFIRAGQIQYLSDSTHKLAGQTVPLPDLPEWAL